MYGVRVSAIAQADMSGGFLYRSIQAFHFYWRSIPVHSHRLITTVMIERNIDDLDETNPVCGGFAIAIVLTVLISVAGRSSAETPCIY